MNNKKVICLALGAVLLALSLSAEAQQAGKVHRIGYLFTGMLPPNEFLQGLRNLGYVEGQNIIVEYRGAEGKEDRLPTLAADLVRLKVDVIVAPSRVAAQVAKQATTTIPIVYMGGADPVAAGLVASIARPGGNITGILELSRELTAKRLELLKEAFPKISRVAVLARAPNPGTAAWLEEMKVVAPSLGLKLQPLEVQGPADFDVAFKSATKGQADALIELPNPLFHANRKRIVEFANQKRLPAIFHSRDFVDAGGLMFYGENDADTLRRLVSYVDKILKGAKPADLPVEQPTKFELIINLKAAKQIGLTIPPNVLARADRVIK
jgi:putative ABC transport system substrate-binding protein